MQVNIVVQYFTGCPHADGMLSNVREAISTLQNSITYEEVIVDSDENAVSLKFRGSPTLLINGEDYEGMPLPDTAALTCRYYKDGIPSADDIRKKILKLL